MAYFAQLRDCKGGGWWKPLVIIGLCEVEWLIGAFYLYALAEFFPAEIEYQQAALLYPLPQVPRALLTVPMAILVAAGLARRCEVQLAYAIGIARPVSIHVETFGTAHVDEAAIEAMIGEHFHLPHSSRMREASGFRMCQYFSIAAVHSLSRSSEQDHIYYCNGA